MTKDVSFQCKVSDLTKELMTKIEDDLRFFSATSLRTLDVFESQCLSTAVERGDNSGANVNIH